MGLRSLRAYIRYVIKEEIGRDYKSIKTMPMDYLHYPELSVSVDYLTSKDKWVVGIRPKSEKKKEYRYFNSQEDAENWARTQADHLRARIMNSQSNR